MALSHISTPALRRLFTIGLAVIIALGAVSFIAGTAHADDGDNCLPNYDNSCNSPPPTAPEPQQQPSQSGSSGSRQSSYTAGGTSLGIAIGVAVMTLGAGPAVVIGATIVSGAMSLVLTTETGGSDGSIFSAGRGSFNSPANCDWIYSRLGGAQRGCE